MNKYQEAFERLKKYAIFDEESQCEKDLNLIQELVDKANPKKRLKDYSINAKYPRIKFEWKCPNCNNGLLIWFDEEPSESDEYCSFCGQHIDWRED